jgi:hypothetical protein
VYVTTREFSSTFTQIFLRRGEVIFADFKQNYEWKILENFLDIETHLAVFRDALCMQMRGRTI